jgi:hypothetical protein
MWLRPNLPRVITVVMEIVAHGFRAAAAAIAGKRSVTPGIRVGWTVWWAAFPDVLAFGPLVAAAVWLRLAGRFDPSGGFDRSPVHIGLPLYQAGHSLVVFLVVFGVATVTARRIVFEMLGWLLHILIDIPTHRFSYYATRFLWPLSDYRVPRVRWCDRGHCPAVNYRQQPPGHRPPAGPPAAIRGSWSNLPTALRPYRLRRREHLLHKRNYLLRVKRFRD